MQNQNINKYSNLNNDELFATYQKIRKEFLKSELGTQKEEESKNNFRLISKEIDNRDNFDLAMYKMKEHLTIGMEFIGLENNEEIELVNNIDVKKQSIKQNKSNMKGSNNMRTLRNIIKSTIITGAITIMTCIPVIADTQPIHATVINSTELTITVQADNKVYSFDNEDNAQDRWQVGENMTMNVDNDKVTNARPIAIDKKIKGVYTESNDNFCIAEGDVITEFEDNSYYINSNVEIQSIDCLDNSITVTKNNGELYKFYVDEPREYYLNEQINITMDQDYQLVDKIVDNEPQVYNTQIDDSFHQLASKLCL